MNCSSPGRIAHCCNHWTLGFASEDVSVDDRLAHSHSNANFAISYPPVLSDKSTTMENSRQESFKKVTEYEYAMQISN